MAVDAVSGHYSDSNRLYQLSRAGFQNGQCSLLKALLAMSLTILIIIKLHDTFAVICRAVVIQKTELSYLCTWLSGVIVYSCGRSTAHCVAAERFEVPLSRPMSNELEADSPTHLSLMHYTIPWASGKCSVRTGESWEITNIFISALKACWINCLNWCWRLLIYVLK